MLQGHSAEESMPSLGTLAVGRPPLLQACDGVCLRMRVEESNACYASAFC